MAKVKNTGGQPRGFITEGGTQVVVKPGEEAEFNMTEEDFKFQKELLDGMDDDAQPYELSGSAGGVKKKDKKKDDDEVEMPAQSVEPPTPSGDVIAPVATPLHDKKHDDEKKPASGTAHQAPPPRK